MGIGKERSLVLLKPDAVQRGIMGKIISRFEDVGLNLIACRMLNIDEELAGKHYAVHKDKPFFGKLVDYITSGTVMALALEGTDAIDLIRKLVGSTDGRTAAPGTIRGDFGRDLTNNLVHASDSPESAEYEIALYFSEDDYTDWNFEIEHWYRRDDS